MKRKLLAAIVIDADPRTYGRCEYLGASVCYLFEMSELMRTTPAEGPLRSRRCLAAEKRAKGGE